MLAQSFIPRQQIVSQCSLSRDIDCGIRRKSRLEFVRSAFVSGFHDLSISVPHLSQQLLCKLNQNSRLRRLARWHQHC
jgi:hypothetical protein